MKINSLFIIILLLFTACTPKPTPLSSKLPHTNLVPATFDDFESTNVVDYRLLIHMFQKECASKKVQNLYPNICKNITTVQNAKDFIYKNLVPYQVYDREGEKSGLLTGYYEPELFGSLQRSETYKYPLYAEPEDLITVDLSAIYPELKRKRLRGRVVGKKLLPYYSRSALRNQEVNATVICYVDNEIDLFFLEVQGSGRVTLDTNTILYVGYANQNGHRYKAIGRYLIQIGALNYEEVSLQSIRAWLEANPTRVQELLDYNPSQVFFQKRDQAASGSLGIELTPLHSIAVDRKYIPLGILTFIQAKENNNSLIGNYAFAQDTGGAIKGGVRADYFLGFGHEAQERAGKLKAPLLMWVLLPSSIQNKIESQQ